MKALVIKADETQELIEIGDGAKELQDAVGGYIELIIHMDDWIMYANEEGNLLGLPLNKKASSLAVATCQTYGKTLPLGADRLAGNVVIVGADDSADNVPIPDEWIERFQEMGLWA